MTKDERYELIALIAQRVDEYKITPEVEEKQVWDSSDVELDFGNFVSNQSYNMM